jgi:RND family efflux transporter MFP subunit
MLTRDRMSRRFIHLPIAFALAVTAASCGPSSSKPQETETKTTVPIEALSVGTAKVERSHVVAKITGSGNVTPLRLTDIGPSVDGIIEAVMVGVGDTVKKGQPLFKTRDVDIRLQVQEMDRQVALARAQLANAQADLRRQNALKSGGWVSASRMDAMRTNAAVTSAQAGVWEARLAQARQQLTDTIVRAPYDGVITRKDVYEGRFMATRFGGMPGGASGVVQIMDIDTVAAIVNVPEIYVSQIKLDMPVRVSIDGFDKPVDAKVDVINHRVDNQTRSVEVRIGIANKDHKILPGLYCSVDLIPTPREVLAVDRKAVLGGDGAHYAFIAENGRAKKIALSTRDLDAERFEILSNVPAGTALLTGPNLSGLSDGIAVAVEAPVAPPAPVRTTAKQ